MAPAIPRSPGRTENPPIPGSRWKKGRLIGRGTFGHVYLGFNRSVAGMVIDTLPLFLIKFTFNVLLIFLPAFLLEIFTHANIRLL